MTQRICHHLVAAYPNFNIPKYLTRNKLNLLSQNYKEVSEISQRIKYNYEKMH